MKTKWWRWWIVPLIFTILTVLFTGSAVIELALVKWVGISRAWIILGLLFIYPFQILTSHADSYFVLWPLFLVVVWPAALIIHVVWKRRKAKKGVLRHPPAKYNPALKTRCRAVAEGWVGFHHPPSIPRSGSSRLAPLYRRHKITYDVFDGAEKDYFGCSVSISDNYSLSGNS